MNKCTNINLSCDQNGTMTLTNDDGEIVIFSDGTIRISTLAPIELAGVSLGKLDDVRFPDNEPTVSFGVQRVIIQRIVDYLAVRGKKS